MELSEEAKAAARAEKEAEDLRSRWTEEYFEIVEQLPLEVHRTFALMRELEGQMQARVNGMVQNMVTYRDARAALQAVIDDPDKEKKVEIKATMKRGQGVRMRRRTCWVARKTRHMLATMPVQLGHLG